MKYLIGIDIGTTSVKVILISTDGIIVDESTESHNLISLYPNWAEEDALIWWENTIRAVRSITSRNKEKVLDIAAIGCSGMVPAIVLLDDNKEPLRKTIQQNDARAVEQIECIKNTIDQDELFELTGGYTNQQNVLPRILWVKQNEPDIWEKTKTILGSYDFIIYKLTGVLSIEKNWAVESGLYNIGTNQWIQKYLDYYNFSSSILPKVNDSISVVGATKDFIQLMGLPSGIPVIAGSADHVASTLAAGIINEGDLLIKFGGAGDILYCTNEVSTLKSLFFDCHIVPDRYLINGCMAASGSLVKWFVKDIAGIDNTTTLMELDERASKIKPASDGLVILPYFLGEKTPLFDPQARGVIFGLKLFHTKEHIFRAILEAVVYGFKHHIEVMEKSGFKPNRVYATNGGAKSSFWCQIAADVLDFTICSYPSHPGSALGVAFLAGMSVGVFSEWEEIFKFLKDAKIFYPKPENTIIYNKSYSVYRKLYCQLKDSFHEIDEIYR